MFKRLTLAQTIILVLLVAFSVASWSVTLIVDRQLRDIADRSQSEIYGERLDKILQYLNEKNELLQATGMREAYIDAFQQSTLDYLRRVYLISNKQDVYPFVQQIDGTALLHPRISTGDTSYANAPFSMTARKLVNGEFDYDYFGEPKWAIVRTFEPWGWQIGFAVPQRIKYQDALALGKRLAGILAFITMLTCTVVSVVIWRMTKPVRQLARAAQAISQGDMTVATPVDGKGDIRILAQAFVTMRESVRERIESLHHEILERKRTEEKLKRAKKAAEAANQAKSLFLANMSHELRTPLNGVMGMLQLMRETNLTDEQADYSEMAVVSCRRLTNLLGDILDLSRVESGAVEVRIAPFDLAENIRAVDHLFSSAASQADIELTFDIDPDAPNILLGDEQKLQQVLNNLVGNALKFTRKGSVAVSVSAMPDLRDGERRLLISVADTGIGIPDDRLGGLFKPFTQAEDSLTRKYQGAGLGLSIVKRLIQLMGGSLAVETEAGVGSTFHACIPFGVIGGRSEHESPVVNLVATPCEGQRVLVAEDDKVSSIAVTRQLEKAGATVRAVGDGQDALEALLNDDFDFVLMDIQMPGLDGVTATRRIRAGEAGDENADIPIIALTAYSMVGDEARFLEAGMSGYVAKPVDFVELLTAIETVTAKR